MIYITSKLKLTINTPEKRKSNKVSYLVEAFFFIPKSFQINKEQKTIIQNKYC